MPLQKNINIYTYIHRQIETYINITNIKQTFKPKRKVLSCFLKLSMSLEFLKLGGSWFQSLGAHDENARFPYVSVIVMGPRKIKD
jgi:hypothetical protein